MYTFSAFITNIIVYIPSIDIINIIAIWINGKKNIPDCIPYVVG